MATTLTRVKARNRQPIRSIPHSELPPDAAWPAPSGQDPAPLIRMVVITAGVDPDRREPQLRVRFTSDVVGGHQGHFDSKDVAEVLSFVERWLAAVRDAAVTPRPRGPVTVIRPGVGEPGTTVPETDEPGGED